MKMLAPPKGFQGGFQSYLKPPLLLPLRFPPLVEILAAVQKVGMLIALSICVRSMCWYAHTPRSLSALDLFYLFFQTPLSTGALEKVEHGGLGSKLPWKQTFKSVSCQSYRRRGDHFPNLQNIQPDLWKYKLGILAPVKYLKSVLSSLALTSQAFHLGIYEQMVFHSSSPFPLATQSVCL